MSSRFPGRMCLLPCLTLVALTLGSSSGAAARQRTRDGVLIVAPLPLDRSADSAYVIQLASHLRTRFKNWRRNVVTMVPFCEETDFCDFLLPDSSVYTYARILGADFYLVGRLGRSAAGPWVDLRVMETGRQGGIPHYTTSLTVQGESGMPSQEFASRITEVLRDTLVAAMRGAHDARQCWDKVRLEDYDGARERAERVFRRYPNHPSAAMCLAYVFSSTDQPGDSIIFALERAVEGDSLLVRAWERLGQEYLRRGDTAGAVRARGREVRADPGNMQRRLRIAQLMDRLGRHEVAVQLIRAGIQSTRTDLGFRRLLGRMCLQYQMWRCALDALADQYALDSSLVGDTTFYYQVIGLSQTLEDTASVTRWTTEAVLHVESLVDQAWERVEQQRLRAEQTEATLRSFLMAQAGSLRDAGDKDSALALYRRIWEADPDNVRAPIAAAQLLTSPVFLPLSPGEPFDTTAFRTADALLTRAARRGQDDEAMRSVARAYLETGMRLVQARTAPAFAVDWLGKARDYDRDNALHAETTALEGVALFYLVQEVDMQVRAEQTCDLVQREADLIERGRSAIVPGQTRFPGVAQQVLAGLDAYQQLIPELRTAFECDASSH